MVKTTFRRVNALSEATVYGISQPIRLISGQRDHVEVETHGAPVFAEVSRQGVKLLAEDPNQRVALTGGYFFEDNFRQVGWGIGYGKPVTFSKGARRWSKFKKGVSEALARVGIGEQTGTKASRSRFIFRDERESR